MTNERACAIGEGFPTVARTKPFQHPMTIEAGALDEQVFRIEALVEALEKLIWHNDVLIEGGRDSGQGSMIELISVIRKDLDCLGHRVST
ncbi:hypothetical protein PVW53_05390 [Seohaeicola sp. SP36]|uniref:hypothetical protein n=1 Tax=unclassified Seohaeicola TaxID=2641111 RepID=UPI00237A2A3E|nr:MULTISPECIES: hypothetical protein [unclassified Seohaeicola]MDD9708764.1 hypothetical protein [Seohaeicola sp. 4SK31]MDD9734945.1 hypothetical protein [Seohaeicola sp. SP36]